MWTSDRDFPAPVFDLGGAPAGNITATLGDLTAYAQLLLRGGDDLVAPETLETMWTPAGPERPATGYGLGFSIDSLDGHRSIGHGGVVYGYASSLQLLPDAGLGAIVFGTLDCCNEIIARIGRRALRLALATRGRGPWPRPARRLAPAGVETAAALAGSYAAPGGATLELRAVGTRLVLLDDGVPIEIRPIGQGRFVLDGRLYGEETTHPFPALELTTVGDLRWKNVVWSRTSDDLVELPPELAPHLGAFGPSFMPAELRYANGELHCLMEYFSPAVCTPLGGDRYLMRGGMYDRETLELGVRGTDGTPAIRVGEMILDRRRD
jgi:D-alanyl-D-alanine dipeptidase